MTAHEIVAQPGGPSDPAEVKAFLDHLIGGQLEKHQIPGAGVVVVKDGQILYAGGYGFADVDRELPFVPEQTLIRIGSTGKLLTWTAVMQLVEEGKIDLDADVNTYLKDFQIPASYPQAITMRHLMSHTGGFEETMLGGFVDSPEEMIPLGEYVMRFVPARVRPPGELTAYSNYGATLAGYIVEVVSGIPFEAYVENEIFEPLGMTRSTFRQPLPAGLADDLAVSYNYAGEFRAQPMIYINQTPAGSMSTTVTDLAQFMIAHLQNGLVGATRILETSTARQMHARLFSNDRRLSGMAYGFMDQEINGQRVLHHGGGFPSYIGLLALLPEQGSGFYVGYTGGGGGIASAEFRDEYFDHYYPRPPALDALPALDGSRRAGALAGYYRWTRLNLTSLESLGNLTGAGYGKVSENTDGTITLDFALGVSRLTTRARETGPWLFVSDDGRRKFGFGNTRGGVATTLSMDDSPHVAYERIPWFDLPSVRIKLLAASLLVLLSYPLASGFRLVLRLRRSLVKPSGPPFAEGIAAGLTAAAVLVIAGMAGFLWMNAHGQGQGLYTALLHGLAWLFLLLTLMVLMCAVAAWIRLSWSPLQRMHYTLLAPAAVGLLSCLDFWNVIDLAT